jgi:hypothetical protein
MPAKGVNDFQSIKPSCKSEGFFYFVVCRLPPGHSMSGYKVYVVELSKRVFTENARFRDANPQFNGVLECLYVGMTSKDPAVRLQQHKTKAKSKKGYNLSAWLVFTYGRFLRPSLYTHLNEQPMTRQEALAMEKKLAIELRRKGYAVWSN